MCWFFRPDGTAQDIAAPPLGKHAQWTIWTSRRIPPPQLTQFSPLDINFLQPRVPPAWRPLTNYSLTRPLTHFTLSPMLTDFTLSPALTRPHTRQSPTTQDDAATNPFISESISRRLLLLVRKLTWGVRLLRRPHTKKRKRKASKRRKGHSGLVQTVQVNSSTPEKFDDKSISRCTFPNTHFKLGSTLSKQKRSIHSIHSILSYHTSHGTNPVINKVACRPRLVPNGGIPARARLSPSYHHLSRKIKKEGTRKGRLDPFYIFFGGDVAHFFFRLY